MKQLSDGLRNALEEVGFKIMTYPAKGRIDVILGNVGIEIDDDGVRGFAGINGGFDRSYGAVKNEIIKNALAEIRAERDNNSMGKPADTEPEQQGSTSLVIPEIITNDVIESHQGAIKTLLMMQVTDKKYIKRKMVARAKNGKPAKYVSYVDGSYMTRCLNYAFLFDWSFEVPETRQDEDQFTALGVLTANVDGRTVIKSQWGSQRINTGMELGDALKGATTDALKKCASLFGIAADVYAGECND